MPRDPSRDDVCAALGRVPEPANGQEGAENVLRSPDFQSRSILESQSFGSAARRSRQGRFWAALALTAALAATGCGGGITTQNRSSAGVSSNGTFSIAPTTLNIDTNCTGCNQAGSGYEQFTAANANGSAANVTWSVSGGDAFSKAGSISASGQYTPPSYLTADSVTVTVTATSTADSSQTASAKITVTPGFLQPLSPENVALGAGGSVTLTGYIAEVGGTDNINFATSNNPTGSSGGQGALAAAPCTRGNLTNGSFTYCSATYTAPAAIPQTGTVYIVGTIGNTASRESTDVLLNSEGITSNPASHQSQLSTPVLLGSSGGNNNDYDTNTQNGKTSISDCCGGTLGSLIKDSSGNQYILSNNHVLARSDQASDGEMIVQPGLIDNNPSCEPEGQGGNETPVGVLKGFVPVKSNATDVDAAIASVNSGAVNASGAILELGTQSGDTLSAAPPGISSTGGTGEEPAIGMTVAKSGRTTGLTCGSISSVALQVQVSYYTNCAETDPYYTKTYTNQIGITGSHFADAGDSGALIVDTGDAEPVGLFFAGGEDTTGEGQGVANLAPEVLNELKTYVGNNSTTYSWVGTKDHPVSCLNYGSGTLAAAQSRSLSGAEMDRVQSAMMDARALVNPSAGILGVATGKSSDRPGKSAVIVYVNPGQNPSVPATVDGVRTVVIPATAQAVAMGAAPQSLAQISALPQLPEAALHRAIATQQQIATGLMKQNPAFFGVGVGQSLDDPRQAALVIYVDKNAVPAQLPETIDGLRTRYIVMERLHVTRAYMSPTPWHSRCMAHGIAAPARHWNLLEPRKLRGFHLY